jgi:GTP cyclohydrolase I
VSVDDGATPAPAAAPAVDLARIEAAVTEILLAIGEDPAREGLVRTPARVARMYAEVFAGLHQEAGDHLKVTFAADHDEMVMVRDIPCYSFCEHHLLPFHGTAHVAYIPGVDGRITGLSKVARLVDAYAKRPQVQERLTAQIADEVERTLQPRGVLVVVEAEHLCMSMRGVRKPGSTTVTSASAGCSGRTRPPGPRRWRSCTPPADRPVPGCAGVAYARRVRGLVMGIVNVTPDSFSDGGRLADADAAIAHGLALAAAGADVVDVGGESTRPGARPSRLAEELDRVVPVVRGLAPHVRVSVDTRTPEVAERAVAAGATLVNDVSASLWEVAAAAGAGWVAMHMQGEPATMQDDPRYGDVVTEVRDHLVERAEAAGAAGVREVWIDPGIGFGKDLGHNLELLARLDELVACGLPVVVGDEPQGLPRRADRRCARGRPARGLRRHRRVGPQPGRAHGPGPRRGRHRGGGARPGRRRRAVGA